MHEWLPYDLEDIDGWKVLAVVPAIDGKQWYYELVVSKGLVKDMGWRALGITFAMVQFKLTQTAMPFDPRRIEWFVRPFIIPEPDPEDAAVAV